MCSGVGLGNTFSFQINVVFVCLMQVSQADVKLFFESVCGEVCNHACLENEVMFLNIGLFWLRSII